MMVDYRKEAQGMRWNRRDFLRATSGALIFSSLTPHWGRAQTLDNLSLSTNVDFVHDVAPPFHIPIPGDHITIPIRLLLRSSAHSGQFPRNYSSDLRFNNSQLDPVRVSVPGTFCCIEPPVDGFGTDDIVYVASEGELEGDLIEMTIGSSRYFGLREWGSGGEPGTREGLQGQSGSELLVGLGFLVAQVRPNLQAPDIISLDFTNTRLSNGQTDSLGRERFEIPVLDESSRDRLAGALSGFVRGERTTAITAPRAVSAGTNLAGSNGFNFDDLLDSINREIGDLLENYLESGIEEQADELERFATAPEEFQKVRQLRWAKDQLNIDRLFPLYPRAWERPRPSPPISEPKEAPSIEIGDIEIEPGINLNIGEAGRRILERRSLTDDPWSYVDKTWITAKIRLGNNQEATLQTYAEPNRDRWGAELRYNVGDNFYARGFYERSTDIFNGQSADDWNSGVSFQYKLLDF